MERFGLPKKHQGRTRRNNKGMVPLKAARVTELAPEDARGMLYPSDNIAVKRYVEPHYLAMRAACALLSLRVTKLYPVPEDARGMLYPWHFDFVV